MNQSQGMNSTMRETHRESWAGARRASLVRREAGLRETRGPGHERGRGAVDAPRADRDTPDPHIPGRLRRVLR
jgi:hypothetical protein